jgi:hypothetical protein
MLLVATPDIISNIENNIKLHFFNYVRCYVNGTFNYEYDDNISQNENFERKKQLKSELYHVKEDLINGTLNSDQKYHSWIKEKQTKIFPPKGDKDKIFAKNLESKPQQYFKYMIFMNRELEDKKVKTFNVFPLRSSCTPKYITIDTQTIVHLLMKEKGDSKYLKKISTKADIIWHKFFKTESYIFRKKNYHFNHLIHTDGVGASISFLSDKGNENKTNKFTNYNKDYEYKKKLCEGKNKKESKIILERYKEGKI